MIKNERKQQTEVNKKSRASKHKNGYICVIRSAKIEMLPEVTSRKFSVSKCLSSPEREREREEIQQTLRRDLCRIS